MGAAVAAALRERLQRARSTGAARSAAGVDSRARPQGAEAGSPAFRSVEEIQGYVAALPVLGPRAPDAIVGYDEHGLPT